MLILQKSGNLRRHGPSDMVTVDAIAGNGTWSQMIPSNVQELWQKAKAEEVVWDAVLVVRMIRTDGSVEKSMKLAIFVDKTYISNAHLITICRFGAPQRSAVVFDVEFLSIDVCSCAHRRDL